SKKVTEHTPVRRLCQNSSTVAAPGNRHAMPITAMSRLSSSTGYGSAAASAVSSPVMRSPTSLAYLLAPSEQQLVLPAPALLAAVQPGVRSGLAEELGLRPHRGVAEQLDQVEPPVQRRLQLGVQLDQEQRVSA